MLCKLVTPDVSFRFVVNVGISGLQRSILRAGPMNSSARTASASMPSTGATAESSARTVQTRRDAEGRELSTNLLDHVLHHFTLV